jgi:hypothetical protein
MTDGTRIYNGHTIHVYEGQNVDFTQCGEAAGCGVGNIATLSNFSPLGAVTNGTVWEITDIPDCAYNLSACGELLDLEGPSDEDYQEQLCDYGLYDGIDNDGDSLVDEDDEAAFGVLRLVGSSVDSSGDPLTCETAPRELLVRNVTAVLPQDLLAEFNLPDGFPDLLMPPQVRAQEILGNTFDALLFDAGDAQSAETPELLVDARGYGCPAASIIEGMSPLNSSVVLRMRERALTGGSCIDDVSGGRSCTLDEHAGSVITYDCFNPSRSRGCCSLYPANVQLANRQAALKTVDNELRWYIDSEGDTDPVEDDSAAAKFIDSHFEQLEVFEYPACSDVDDPGEAQPLDSATCNQLAQKRLNARDKLVNALSNTSTGTNCSQSSRNYQSFLSQIENYIAIAKSYEGNLSACNDGEDNDGDYLVDEDDTDCASPAQDRLGRVQALIAHASVLPYVVNEILQPTIPAICETGWIEDDSAWITD